MISDSKWIKWTSGRYSEIRWIASMICSSSLFRHPRPRNLVSRQPSAYSKHAKKDTTTKIIHMTQPPTTTSIFSTRRSTPAFFHLPSQHLKKKSLANLRGHEGQLRRLPDLFVSAWLFSIYQQKHIPRVLCRYAAEKSWKICELHNFAQLRGPIDCYLCLHALIDF